MNTYLGKSLESVFYIKRQLIMKYLILTIIMIISLFPEIYAQQDAYLSWAKSFGCHSAGACKRFEFIRGVTTDTAGNFYNVGQFSGSIDFDPGPGNTTLTAISGNSVFIQKLDVNGDFVWAKMVTGADEALGYAIALAPDGSIYVTGLFLGTADFDPGSGIYNLTSTVGMSGYHNRDIFILKLDVNGDFVWAKTFSGNESKDAGTRITVDNLGNLYLAGYFRDSIDFDLGPNIHHLVANGDNDAFVLKLDVNGDFVWANSMGGTGADGPTGIDVDAAGNTYLTGIFNGNAQFPTATGTTTRTSLGNTDIFIQKFSPTGIPLWLNTLGGTGYDRSTGARLDSLGYLYTAGYFTDTVDFDLSSNTYNIVSSGVYNGFIQKQDTNGNFIWAKALLSNDGSTIHSMDVDQSGNVYLAGGFLGTLDTDPNVGINNLVTTKTTYDFFMEKLSSNGQLVWAKPIYGPGLLEGTSLYKDNKENFYITGRFTGDSNTGTLDVDPGPGVVNLTTIGSLTYYADPMVLKFNENCSSSTSSVSPVACGSYIAPDSQVYTNSGTYQAVLQHSGGCTNTIDINLIVIDSNASSVPYQEDFQSGFPPIAINIFNEDNSTTWTSASIIGVTGTPTTAVYIDNNTYNAPGQKDYIYLPKVDLINQGATQLSFDLSYKPYSTTYYDSLYVEISTDCGATYQRVYQKGNLDLSIDGTYFSSTWTPTSSSDWIEEKIDLSAYIGSEVLIRFVAVNGYGNNLYLDNINVDILSNLSTVQSEKNWLVLS